MLFPNHTAFTDSENYSAIEAEFKVIKPFSKIITRLSARRLDALAAMPVQLSAKQSLIDIPYLSLSTPYVPNFSLSNILQIPVPRFRSLLQPLKLITSPP